MTDDEIYAALRSPAYYWMGRDKWLDAPLARDNQAAAVAAWDKNEARLLSKRERNRASMRRYRAKKRQAAQAPISTRTAGGRPRKEKCVPPREPVTCRIERAKFFALNTRIAAVWKRTGKEPFRAELCEAAVLALLDLSVDETVTILAHYTKYGPA